MPWARISALPRSAAPRVLRTGTSLRVAGEAGAEGRGAPVVVVAAQGHGDVQAVGRDRHGDVVRAVDAVEGRDVHRLAGLRAALLVGVDEVGVAVAVGVVHLDDDAGLTPLVVEAPEDADRVEAVAHRPRVGGHQDRAGALASPRVTSCAARNDSTLARSVRSGEPRWSRASNRASRPWSGRSSRSTSQNVEECSKVRA